MDTFDHQSAKRRHLLIRQWLLIWLPLAGALLAGVAVSYRHELNEELTTLLAKQRHQVDLATTGAFQMLRGQAAHLLELAHGHVLVHWSEIPTEAEREELAWHFANVIRHDAAIDQVRLLDRQGREVVRVNRAGGQSRTVPRDELQDKSQRYYFRESIDLAPGEIAVSRFDLNVENEQLELPFKPTLRMATPVYNLAGQNRGVLVINFLGAKLLESLAEHPDDPGRLVLLDSEGFWLRGLDPEDQWGFMLPERRDRSFATRFPWAWRRMAGTERGQFYSEGGLFTFDTLRAPGSGREPPGWFIVSLLDAAQWRESIAEYRRGHGLALLELWALAGLLAWLLARARVQRTLAERELRRSEQLLSTILDAAAEGVIALGPAREILVFNPAAELIFGYDQAEAIGRPVESLVDPAQREAAVAYLTALAAGDQGVHPGERKELLGLRKDGRTVPLEVVSSPTSLAGERPLVVSLVRDISERRRAAQVLRAEREKLRLFVDNVPLPVAMFDLDLRYLYASHRWSQDYHLENVAIIGRTHYEIFPDLPSSWRENNRRCLQGEILSSERDLLVRADGSADLVRWEMHPWHQEDGRVGGLIMFTEIITEKVRAEDERDRFFALSLDLLGIIGTDGGFRQLNPAWERLLGFPEASLRKRSFFDLIHSADHAMVQLKAREASRGAGLSRFDCRVLCREGDYKWVSWNYLALPEQGLAYVQGRDVTERRQMLDDLRAQKEHLRAIVDGAVEGIVTMDEEGIIQSFNPAAEAIFGYGAGEMVGQKVNLLQPEPHRGRHEQYVANYLRDGAPRLMGHPRELVARRRDGREFPIHLSVSEVRHGERRLFIGILRDITREKQAAEALEKAKEAAEEANRTKSVFLASMSHEIRTPLNAILGMAELLAETRLDPEQRRFVRTFQEAGGNLLSIINDILDLSKAEAGRMNIESIPFALADLAEEVCAFLRPRARAKGLGLGCRVAPELPARVLGDPLRLRQVLVNLLGNAVKFTERGEVGLRVARWPQPSPEGKDQLHFLVEDTGIGIPADKLASVFDRFTQADASVARRYGGTGLGLAISRRLVGLMGGRIWVESREGLGSQFHFCLPLAAALEPAPAPAEPPRPPVEPPSRPLKVLLVDDSPDNRLLVESFLKSTPYRLTIAHDGREAVAKFQAEGFDLVLMDIQMPELDGYEATRLMRAWEAGQGRPETPIVALTAYALEEERQRSLAAGCTDHLVKPINKKDLLAAIARNARAA